MIRPFTLSPRRARLLSAPLGLLALVTIFAALPGAARAQQRWVARYGVPNTANESPTAIAADAHGDVFVTGSAAGGSNTDYVTVKYSGVTGAQLWEARYNGPRGLVDNAAALVVDSENNVIVTGNSDGVGTGSDFATVKYNGVTGAQLWEARYNGGGIDAARAIGVDEFGDVFVAGGAQRQSDYDFATVKYDGVTGVQAWATRYNGPAQSGDSAFALAVDRLNNVIVTGESQGATTSSDFATIKYNGQNGTQIWLARYSGPGSQADSAKALALDANDNVIVTGESKNENGDYDYATVKYNGATGTEVWASRYDDAAHTENAAYALALDADGDVFVTGGGAHGGNNPLADYGTVKYNGATGAQAWAKAYNGRDNNYDSAYDIAVDSSGNVIVTGGSGIAGDGLSFDYVTVRYDNDTGAQTWAARYGNGGAGDVAVALALDSRDNLFVTGESNGDYATVKYAAATPPPLGAGYQAVDIAAGNGVTPDLVGAGDASLRVLWSNPAARGAQVWSAQAGATVNGYSPLFTGSAGFAGVGLTVSPTDNRSRVLWNNETARRTALYTLPATLGGLETGSSFGPLANAWVVVDAQTGGDGKVRMLWRQPSTGKLALWRLNAAASAVEAGGSINPPVGYTLLPQIAVSPSDNKTRLAWLKNSGGNGQVAIWTMGVNLTTIETGRTYAATGYTVQGFGVGADNKMRLLWARINAPASVSLWTLPANGANNVIESAKAYALPAPMRAARLRVSPANKYLLLVVPANPPPGAAPRAEAWVVSPNAQVRESVTLLGD